MRRLRRVSVVLLAALVVLPAAPATGVPGLDAGFGDGGVVKIGEGGGALATVVQPDGRILVGGWLTDSSPARYAVVRLLPGGQLDTGFGNGGRVVLADSGFVTSLAVQPDGRILASMTVRAEPDRLDVFRLTSAGQLDATFGSGGKVEVDDSLNIWGHLAALAVQADGKILLAHARFTDGKFDMEVTRLAADGTADGDFGTGGSMLVDFSAPGEPRNDFATSVAVLPDGRIVVGGQSWTSGPFGRAFGLARLTSGGVLDATFGTGGKVLTQVPVDGVPQESVFRSLVARPDGTVLAAGSAYTGTSLEHGGDFAFVRYTATGALDPTFGAGGFATVGTLPEEGTTETLLGLAIGPAGRIVGTGSRRRDEAPWGVDFLTVRLLASGAPDPTFGGAGRVVTRLSAATHEATAVAVQSDGAIVVVGGGDDLPMVVVRYPETTGVKSFGWNPVGQLGNGSNTDAIAGVAAPALYGATAVSSGAYHGLATKGDGTLWAWGWNGVGQLGDGTTWDRWSPVPVPHMDYVTSFSAGQFHSLAVDGDSGRMFAWGWNATGQLGDGTTSDRHSPVALGPSGIVGVAAGQYHSLAVTDAGSVLAWGWNGAGQLGTGNTIDWHTPVPVGLTDVVAVAAGYHHSLALKSDGTVWAWGWNVAGQLGDGTNVDRWSPVPVVGVTGVKSISAGAYHSLAVLEDGTVRAWGWNAIGQLGDGTAVDRWSPVPVAGLSDVTSVSGGALHNLGSLRDGTVKAWGWNGVGQLGTGTVVNSAVPVPVNGLSGVNSVAAGLAQSFAVGR